jgi:apolipoprotein N-acyltransferase
VSANSYLSARAVLALAATAGGAYFGTGLHPVWWLTWLAPIPVLLVAPRLSRRSAFAVAFLAWAAGGLNMWRYFRVSLSTPLVIALLVVVLPALVFAADILLYRWLIRRSAWRSALIFPSFWVFYEFLSETNSPHSTFGNLGYSQMNFLLVLQVASITGIWTISFCLFLFAATVSVLLSRQVDSAERRQLGVAVACVLLAVFGFGTWRLYATPAVRNTVKVGLVASDLRQNILTEQPAETLRLMREYASQAETLAARGAQIIVIPEKIAVLLDSELPQVDPLLQSTAAETEASIIVGVVHPTAGAKWNEARLYLPNGTVRTYEKHHMLPVYEGKLTVGTERTEWQEPSGLLGITICKDMDFPHLSREYGNDGAGLLLVPAWDFDDDGWLHGRMAILRGVESGFSIARAPKQGVLSVSDNRARVLAERTSGSAAFATLIAPVPVQHATTIYARSGDWFGWLNGALLLLLLIRAFRKT